MLTRICVLMSLLVLVSACASDNTPPGPHEVVGPQSLMLTDTGRERELEVVFWHPKQVAEKMPLVVYAHGFGGNPEDATWLTTYLASHGYVVAAVRFPGTNTDLGSENLQLNDVINQPGDVSRAIDVALGELPGAPTAIAGRIDPQRIGLVGLSLGGLTTYLAAYDRQLMEPRLSAAIGLAPGAGDIFYPAFYQTRDLPMLIIHGDKDLLVDYPATSVISQQRSTAPRVLARLSGGTHLGFTDVGWLGFNPDHFACMFFTDALSKDPAEVTFHTALMAREPATGVGPYSAPQPCTFTVPEVETMATPRQHALSKEMIREFFAATLLGQSLDDYRTRTRALGTANPDLEIQLAF